MASRKALVLASVGDPGLGAFFGGAARVLAPLFKRAAPLVRQAVPQLAAAGAGALAGAIAAPGPLFGAPGRPGLAPMGQFITISGRTGRPIRLISPTGRVINLARRGRGISASQLRGFHRIMGLLSRVGMSARRRSTRKR